MTLLALSARADKNDKFILRLQFKGNSLTYMNRGADLLEKGDLKSARANLDAAIKEDVDIWPAYLDRAIVSAREGKWQAALSDCQVAVRHRPGFFRTFVIRATVNQHLGRDRESLADLDRVISLHADDITDATAFSSRAMLRATSRNPAVHNPKAAVEDALRACRLDHWQKAIYIDHLAAAYASTEDFESAIRYQKQAIATGKLAPDELENAQRSLLHYQQGGRGR